MIPILLCVLAFLGTLVASRRSLGAGLAAAIGVGYAYGIIRANLLSTPSHLLFDCAVLGLYFGVAPRVVESLSLTASHRALTAWAVALIGWPLMLFFVPGHDSALQVVGLRGNAFLLPFLLIGAMLTTADLRRLAISLSVLNVAALAVAVLEYSTDVRLFFPMNAVTRIIYASNDLVGYSAYRIPASFANAHSYSGTMVVSLPLLIGAFARRQTRWWRTLIGYGGIGAALIGVFLGAARTHAVILFLLVLVVTLSGRLHKRASMLWAVALFVVAGFVLSDARLQRFTQLQDTALITTRIGWSVNESAFAAISGHPLGNGLSGGGTSIPYFLQSNNDDIVHVENEYARIGIEQGTPGLLLWIGFIIWFLTRAQVRSADEWFLGRLTAWVVVAAYCMSGLIGTGLLTSIPQSSLLLLLAGWAASPERQPAAAPAKTGAVPVRPGWRQELAL